MNYYPSNLYGNYSYGAAYPQAVNLPAQNLNQSLLGKVVDGEDVVKATEVPFGGYGVFPKADLSELYIKSWNNDIDICFFTFIYNNIDSIPFRDSQQTVRSSRI